jgi:hypothetical protein
MALKTLQIFKRKNCGLAAVGLILAAMSSSAMAVIIAPSQTLPTTGAGVFGGGLVFDTGPQPFTGRDFTNTVVFTGLLDTKVYSDPTNPFGPGDLDFVYQFSNDPNPNNDNILHLAASSFSGFLTDADFVLGSGTAGNHPTTVARDAANLGDTLDFNFPLASAVIPGDTSAQLVIRTNATTFTAGTVSIQDGGNASINAPAPASVPEPATLSIAGFALCALGMRRRKINNN